MTAKDYCLAMLNSCLMPYVIVQECMGNSEYDTTTKVIRLNWMSIGSVHPKDIAKCVHEAAHAIDHYEWPWLFTIRRYTRYIVLGYFINLFLEWHASHIAYRFLKHVGAFDATQLKQIKKYYRKSLKTYL